MKLLAMLATLTLTAFLSACGDSGSTPPSSTSAASAPPAGAYPSSIPAPAPDAGKVIFTVIAPATDTPELACIKAGITAAQQTRKGSSVALHFEQPADASAQSALIEKQIADKAGAIIFVSTADPAEHLAGLAAANIPVILINTDTASDAYVTRVTTDGGKRYALAAEKNAPADFSPENLAALRSGSITGLVLPPSFKLGREAFDLARTAYALEKKRNTLPKLKQFDPVYLTRETLNTPEATDALGPQPTTAP